MFPMDNPCFAKAQVDNQLSSNTIIIRNSSGPPFYPFYYFNLEDLNFTDAPQPIPVTPLIPSLRALSRLQYLPLPECNGLMLFGPENSDKPIETWEIWNPLTSEGLRLPDPNISGKVVGMGFGYDWVADDYRVVLIDYDGESTRETHVYSLKSDLWRKIGDCPFGFRSRDTEHGVFLNGSLHWISCNEEMIISFDFATEKYLQLALPVLKVTESMNLDALGGCLFLSYMGEEDRPLKRKSDRIFHERHHFDVWVMNDYGAEGSWIKLVSLKNKYDRFRRYNLRPIAYMKSENRVLIKHENFFIWVDAKSNSVKSVDIHGFCLYSEFSAQICARNLLRLHDTCGRIASKITTMKRGAMEKADTKLTFCVRDYEKSKARTSPHGDCYDIELSWLTNSCQGDDVYTSSSNADTESSIPLDICSEIFLHFPATSLIRLRAVCKAYQAIIDEPCFVKAHTNNHLSANTILFLNESGPPFFPCYSFNLDALNFTDGLQPILATPLTFKHSGLSRVSTSVCNGLILVADKTLEMWNPLTNECLQLPRGEFNLDIITSGLGYDYATDDYKVVVIDCCDRIESDDCVYRTHVYSLRSDSWRMIADFPLGDNDWCSEIWAGVFLRGALHWTPWKVHNRIIKLDLGTETYSEMQCPVVRRRHSLVTEQKSLEVLCGCLVWTDYSIANDQRADDMNVWLMQDYGDESSWIKLYCIDEDTVSWTSEGRYRPVAVIKNKTNILLQDEWGLFLFDVESESLKKVHVHGLTKSYYAHAFSGSIFQLHDNCGVSRSGSLTAQRRRIRKRLMDMEISDTELYFCVGNKWLDDSHDGPDSICYYSSSSEDEGMYELQSEED